MFVALELAASIVALLVVAALPATTAPLSPSAVELSFQCGRDGVFDGLIALDASFFRRAVDGGLRCGS
jgi:hypothetical protein